MSNNSKSSGISILGLLGIAFIVLKLTKVIDWSWWYVLLPFYGVLAIVLLVLAVWGLLTIIAHFYKK
jgi:hypothetical protein